MFRPNIDCVVVTTSGKTDVYGKPLLATKRKERCAIIKLNARNVKTAVRADSSASRGSGREINIDAVLLMTKTTSVKMDDIVIVAEQSIKIVGVYPLHDINGKLDHYRVEGMAWSDDV